MTSTEQSRARRAHAKPSPAGPRGRRGAQRAPSARPPRPERSDQPDSVVAALWGTSWRDPHRGISASSALAIVGLGLVGLGPSELGAALTLVGTVGLMASVHRYGRLGPDEPRRAR